MKECNDSWLSFDKYKHILSCFLIGIVSPLMAIGAAITKEWIDNSNNDNHWCWKDLLADMIGVVVASTARCIAAHNLFGHWWYGLM